MYDVTIERGCSQAKLVNRHVEENIKEYLQANMKVGHNPKNSKMF